MSEKLRRCPECGGHLIDRPIVPEYGGSQIVAVDVRIQHAPNCRFASWEDNRRSEVSHEK